MTADRLWERNVNKIIYSRICMFVIYEDSEENVSRTLRAINRATNSPESRKCCPEDTGSGRWSCAPEGDCAGARERRARGGSHFRLAEKNSTWAASGVPLDLRCGLARTRFGGRCRTEKKREREAINEQATFEELLERKCLKSMPRECVRRSDKYLKMLMNVYKIKFHNTPKLLRSGNTEAEWRSGSVLGP